MGGVEEKMGVEGEIMRGGFWTTESGMQVRGKNVAGRGRCRSRHLTTAKVLLMTHATVKLLKMSHATVVVSRAR